MGKHNKKAKSQQQKPQETSQAQPKSGIVDQPETKAAVAPGGKPIPVNDDKGPIGPEGVALADTQVSSVEVDVGPIAKAIGALLQNSRSVFLPGACKFCNCSQIPSVDLLWCDACRLVKYCSKSHQTEDWNNHKPLCKIVRKYLKKTKFPHVYSEVPAKIITDNEWLQIRCRLIHQLQSQQVGHGRHQLEPHELETVLFPIGLCSKCHQLRPLTPCTQCSNAVSFCSAHSKDDIKHNCPELRLWSKLGEAPTNLPQPDIEFRDSIFTGFSLVENSDVLKLLPESVQSFFFRNVLDLELAGEETQMAFLRLSEAVTVPLTVLWAMGKVYQKGMLAGFDATKTLTVHVAGVNDIDSECLKWERYFLHLLPKLVQLNVVFVSPALSKTYEMPILCSDCTSQGRGLRIDFKKTAYQKFMAATSDEVPDIIFLSSPTLSSPSEDEEGSSSLLSVVRLKPGGILIATELNKTDLSQTGTRVISEAGGGSNQKKLAEVPEAITIKNGYRSFRPERSLNCYPTEDCSVEPYLVYRNNYATVFTSQ